MAQETLKITITADNQQAVQNIQQTVTATNQLGTAFKTLPSVSNSATYALSNLSRVAQDAPYGFIGIANNLNPLLESFQRLSKEAGGTGGALKAMASGLIGPAGIGLALGAVSSIIVAFGPQIAEFISGTKKAAEVEDKFATSLRDARAEASETGIRLQAYLSISESANVSEERRAEALKAVVTELSKVNSAYASTITNVDQARAAVDLYTQSLVNQALTTRYIDKIADKTEALNDVNKKLVQSGRDYYKTIDEQNRLIAEGRISAAVDQAVAAKELKKQNIDARKEANALKTEIISTKVEVKNLLVESSKNPFFNFTKGANEAAQSTKKVVDNIQKIGGQARGITPDMTAPILMQRGGVPSITNPTSTTPLGGRTSGYDAIKATRDINEQTKAQELFNFQLQQTEAITGLLAPAFDSVIQAMVMGEDIGLALEAAFKQIVIQLVSMVAQALLFKAILGAITGGTSAIGEAVGGNMGMGGGNFLGEFLLKGSDLVLATQRANNNLNIRRGN